MSTTENELKIKYFERLFETTLSLCMAIEDEYPYELRTTNLSERFHEVLNVLQEIEIEKIKLNGNSGEEPAF